jgi:hypothetical protein
MTILRRCPACFWGPAAKGSRPGWTDESSGRSLSKFVTEELHGFMPCEILGQGFAHLFCHTCHEHHAMAFSCKARAVCPSCLGRRMREGALNLLDHVLPDVPLRQLVVTVPFPLRFPLVFDGALLGQVVRIFVDTVDGWYRRRRVERGLPPGETGAVAVIQRANSDWRLNPHVHVICFDGVHSPDRDGQGRMFRPAPAPSQEDIEQLVERVSKRILRFLQRRGVMLVKNQAVAARILVAMHLPAELPELHPARPPPASERAEREAEDWAN